MKKVINGKMYNTETAESLGYWSYSNRFDLHFMEEELFKTKSGNYFLHCYGGPSTKYAVSQGSNSWSGGEHIEILSYGSAKKWAEERLSCEEYEKIFEISQETEVLVNIKIPFELKFKIDRIRAETGKTISEIVLDMIKV